ncbi:hypothetical protein BC831DRAFT_449286 [Entophlyctis helioformis]|nr:hypothetical protein BC831DRAFT_449286 [Entophlyctis helioformis]
MSSEADPDYHGTLFLVIMLISAAAVIANTVVLAAIMRTRRTPDYFFNLSLVVADTIFALLVTIVSAVSFSNGVPAVRSPASCQIVGITLQATASAAVISIALMSFNQWNVICRERLNVTRERVGIYLLLCWIISIVSSLMVYIDGSGYVIEPANLHCHFDYTSRNPVQVAINIYGDLLLIVVPVVVIWAYVSVWSKIKVVDESIRNVMHTHTASIEMSPTSGSKGSLSASADHRHDDAVLKSSNNSADAPGKTSNRSSSGAAGSSARIAGQFDEALRNVAFRGIAISSVFIALWIGVVALSFVQMFTGKKVSWQVDGISTIIAAINTLANPIIFVSVDRRLRRSVRELVGLDKPPALAV